MEQFGQQHNSRGTDRSTAIDRVSIAELQDPITRAASLDKLSHAIQAMMLSIGQGLSAAIYKANEFCIKSDQSILTEYDPAVEAHLRTGLEAIFPEGHFIGEENSQMTRSEFMSKFENPYLIITDPIDGTLNFANGYPHFAISVGIFEKSELGHSPLMGCVLIPNSGELFFNDQSVAFVKNIYHQQQIELPGARSYDATTPLMIGDAFLRRFDTGLLIDSCFPRLSGCAVADILYVGAGRAAGAVFSSHIWDFAGPLAIVQHTGAYLYNLRDGTRKTHFGPDDFEIEAPGRDWLIKGDYVVAPKENIAPIMSLFAQRR